VNSENPIPENKPIPDACRESDAQLSQSEPEVPPAPAHSQLPPTHATCQITCKTEKDWWDKIKPFLEMAGVVLLAIYTGYTIKMYCANKKAADAAKSAAETAHDAFVKGNRPWVGVDGPLTVTQPPTIFQEGGKENIKASFSFIVKNFGTAPALHYVAEATIVINSPPTPDGRADFSAFTNAADSACRMADSGTRAIVPGEEGSGLYLFPSQPIREEVNNATTSPAPNPITALDVVGCMAYSDQHRGIHHTRFCFMGNRSIKDTKVGQTLLPCPINESAD
jgi:hypothetical protein